MIVIVILIIIISFIVIIIIIIIVIIIIIRTPHHPSPGGLRFLQCGNAESLAHFLLRPLPIFPPLRLALVEVPRPGCTAARVFFFGKLCHVRGLLASVCHTLNRKTTLTADPRGSATSPFRSSQSCGPTLLQRMPPDVLGDPHSL